MKTKTVKAFTVKLCNRYLKEKVKMTRAKDGEEVTETTYTMVKNPAYASLFDKEEQAQECLARFLGFAGQLAEIKKTTAKIQVPAEKDAA